VNRAQRRNIGWQCVALSMSLSGIAIAQEPPAALKEAVVAPPLHPNLHYYFPPEKVVKRTLSADVCIYGGTSCGIIAAVQLAQLGRKVVLIEPSAHLGGMTTGGLSNTDIGNKAAIGGLSREFYHRIGQKYGEEEEWRFEPHVADEVYAAMLKEAAVPTYTKEYLHSVRKQENRITSLLTESGLTVRARCFIDATYEGDLMAQAKVRYVVGRESNTVYGETLDGAQTRDKHQFDAAVDPYVRAGDPTSGLLPGIDLTPVEPNGTGDVRIQAYNFRLCMATTAENRLPFPQPEGYDPAQYQLLARYLATGWNQVFQKFDPIRNAKTDTNNHGAISTDFIGQNYAWPEADYRTRERIFRAHVIYQQGWAWFLANDPSVPEAIRTKMNTFGLCRDEFTETGGWSPQLYVREARRMVSDYVMTEANCRGDRTVPDPVGLAAYTMDSHNCRRFVRDGRVWNEGDVQVGGMPPYPISYRAIVPKKAECANLFVPVCLAASHIAYGSIRMEPVFMILGQSAALAADIALTDNIAVQDVDYGKLRPRLEAAHQILEWKKP
jgi:hypothetical protein